ncbi:unnamed protein product [Calicophoron daubneyi]|uniref:Transient receptor potential cation channel subfamily M member 3 n=1 Tax=Calicophoron daubneyi TaxID=300641 RepID=A0AAV2T8K4_CALDB
MYTPNPSTVRKEGEEPRCYCGEYKQNHFEHGLDVTNMAGTKWSSKTHLKCIQPTNAYGQIVFLTESAGGQRPTEGLVKAAQTTHAWIVTSGLNLGIIRVVGDAIQEGNTFQFSRKGLSDQIRCLGIAPWGYVLNREELISENHSVPVTYAVSTIVETGRPVSLNQNHTHYIFVDEGMRLRYGGSESARFRARLEKQIALSKKCGGWGIPVVLVIVEGGHDVFIDARNSIREHVPVVICYGTGRASDILNLAFTYRMKHTGKEFESFGPEEYAVLSQLITPVSGEQKVDQAISMIIEIVRDVRLITTFDINKSHDLDLAILFALIKTNSDILSQINLAFTWDRSDILEEKIFQQSKQVKPECLEPVMFEALLNDKTDFVRILLQNGVVMRSFLTVGKLHRLYNESTSRDGFVQYLSKRGLRKDRIQRKNVNRLLKFIGKYGGLNEKLDLPKELTNAGRETGFKVYLSTVSALMRKTVGRFSQGLYELDEPELHENNYQWAVLGHAKFASPFQELFLWAILHQRQTMALFFWRRSEDCLALALLACNIYADMITLLPNYDTESLALYEEYIRTFEQLAVQVIEECNSTDAEMARYLIETDSPVWGGFNCLNLAYRSARTEFIGTAACQSSLYFAWQHGIQSGTTIFIITAFIPFLLLSERYFEFHEKLALPILEETKYSNKNYEQEVKISSTMLTVVDTDGVSNGASSVSSANGGDETEPDENEDETNVYFKGLAQSERKLSFNYKLKIFYTAPKTKFFLSSLFYITFLFYFSYALMFRIEPASITVEEGIIMAMFVGFFIDAIRQMAQIPGSPKRKLEDWWSTYSWGKLDVFLLLSATVSMYLRIGLDRTYLHAQTLYSITLIIGYMRVYRLYGFHPHLGPETVMVQRMLGDLVRFLFILGLIFISYGIAIQILLFPNRTEFDWSAVRDIFYYPYFQIWGELNLDYMFETDMMEKAHNEPRTVLEDERLESDRDDGAQLFGFASSHHRPPEIDVEAAPKPRSLRDTVNLFSELKEANVNAAERDESTHLIRQFEMVCLRGVLNKQQQERARSLPASIRLIGSKTKPYLIIDIFQHVNQQRFRFHVKVSDQERKESKSITGTKGQEHTVPLPGQAQIIHYDGKEKAHSEPRTILLQNVPVCPLSLDLSLLNRDARHNVQRTQTDRKMTENSTEYHA